MNYFRIAVLCGLLALFTACKREGGNTLSGQSIGEVATNIVLAARADDSAAFAPIFEPSGDRTLPHLLAMIQKSGMLTNYSSRVETQSPTRAHLNYHDLERGCHFQVDLEKNGGRWGVTRIWFCR